MEYFFACGKIICPPSFPPINPLSANFIKWSITLKQFVGKLPTNCLSELALKGLS